MLSNYKCFAVTPEYDEKRIQDFGFKILSVVDVYTPFNELYSQDNNRWAFKEVPLIMPTNTIAAFVCQGNHSMQFGDTSETFDRPFTHLGVRFNLDLKSAEPSLRVEAGISDKNADDQWFGEISAIVVFLGIA
ncbi:hypothetical protein [Bacillus cereus]|uniref:hypothetical protein n=1 Tax=Bacillus cereus TaxID=1396 RepID=UPI00283E37EA|nr:hypothetical protein [Bacillus cereus]MDR4196398.1 hypothetical protein [Bacillus cereus]MEB9931399.1 hypothetical protein [Bacillus cereus]